MLVKKCVHIYVVHSVALFTLDRWTNHGRPDTVDFYIIIFPVSCHLAFDINSISR